MTGQCGMVRTGLGVTLLLVPSLLAAADRASGRAPGIEPAVVDLFQARDDDQIDVRFIPKDDKGAKLIVTNKTAGPLNVRLPETFVGLPVLAQFGGGMGGGGRGGGMGGGGQAMGGGGGMMGGGGMGGGGMGGGGGFFNIAPEKVAKLDLPCLCLEHGKPDPTPRMKYEIRPIGDFVDRPAVIELVRAFSFGGIPHQAAQAAVWHLNNDMSWNELAAKRRAGRLLFGGRPAYFTMDDLRLAVRLTEESVRRARRDQPDSLQLPQSVGLNGRN